MKFGIEKNVQCLKKEKETMEVIELHNKESISLNIFLHQTQSNIYLKVFVSKLFQLYIL